MKNNLTGLAALFSLVLITACTAVDNSVDSAVDKETKKTEGKHANVKQTIQPSSEESEVDIAKQAPKKLPELAAQTSMLDSSNQLAQFSKRMQGVSDTMHAPNFYRPSPEPYPESTPSTENYPGFTENAVKQVSQFPVSTFSIDVDSASYANVRRILNQGRLPQSDAIRVEELINYFSYQYPHPEESTSPFSVSTEIGPSPWHAGRKLLHIGLKGYDRNRADLPSSNLVFLIDVSGSMRSPAKLELLIPALKMLTKQLREQDSISIAVYAGAAGTVLEPTKGSDKRKIYAALERLSAGGSTNGGAGIRLAYSLAKDAFIKGGINRVILATDGDFNVGTTGQDALKALIEEQRKSGISLTVLGFGQGNYNDALMQQLAQTGNGNAAYIDNINEARKVLVEEISSTLNTIASDVKIQVEFNPEIVSEYRLIGYETRHLNREDFNNDKIDAGEIGAGHTVTALYEVTLVGAEDQSIDPLRYKREKTSSMPNKNGPNKNGPNKNGEIAFIKLRYKPDIDSPSILMSIPVKRADMQPTINSTSQNFRFSAAVAAFAQVLKGGRYTQDYSMHDILALAQASKGPDRYGYRGEFINLVRTADALTNPQLGYR